MLLSSTQRQASHISYALYALFFFVFVLCAAHAKQAHANFYVECRVYATTSDLDKNGFMDFIIHRAETSGGQVPPGEPCLQDRIGVTERVKLKGMELKRHRQYRFILTYKYSYQKNDSGQAVDVEKWFHKGTPIEITTEKNAQEKPAKGQSALPKMQICTQEAKICPDGSAVSRTGPNCEFAPCP